MKFNHLNVPTHWRNYWTRYPEGHTILEAIISWVSQVDSMVDNQNKLNDNVEQFRNEIDAFVERFDDRLQDEVTQTLTDWQTSGFLDVVISEALQWELDNYIATNEADKLSITNSFTEQLSQVMTNVKNFGAKGDGVTDDTDAINEAIQYGNKIFIPAGTYLIGSDKQISLRDNIEIYGIKGKTILVKDNGVALDNIMLIQSPYTTPADSIENISIHDIVFKDNVETLGFLESNHLLTVRGVNGLEVYNCEFIGFRGDGICLAVEDGQHPDGIEHRRNSNVKIFNNVIDGVNKDNRNAISVVSGENVKIFNNTIKNTTRSTMPGAIDIEPNPYPVYTIKNIEVYGNIIDNIGGNVGAIAVVCSEHNAPENISIYQNTLNNTTRSISVRILDSSYDSCINIFENTVLSSNSLGIFVGGNVRGLKVKENKLLKTGSIGLALGFDATGTLFLYDSEIKNNTFESLSGSAILRTSNLNNVEICDNTFLTAATETALQIGINSASTTTKLIFDNNTIICSNSPRVISTVGTIDYVGNTFNNNKSNVLVGSSGLPALPRQNQLNGTLNAVNGSTLLASFPEGMTYCMVNNAENTPGGIGLLTTVKLDVKGETAYNNLSHQIYTVSSGNRYIRYWKTANTNWDDWKKITTETIPAS